MVEGSQKYCNIFLKVKQTHNLLNYNTYPNLFELWYVKYSKKAYSMQLYI